MTISGPPSPTHHLAGILVDDGLIGRDVDAAVLLRGGQAEDVVVLVDRPADGAEAVVTVCHHIGHRKLRQTAGLCRLDDADIGDVVRNECVKRDAQLCGIRALTVRVEDLPRHRLLPAAVRAGRGPSTRPDCGLVGKLQ